MGPGLCVIPSFYSLSHIIQLSLEDIYYIAFPKDRCIIKWIVLVSLLLETVQTCTVTQFAFHTFTIGFSNPAVLDDIGTEWYSIPLITGLGKFVGEIQVFGSSIDITRIPFCLISRYFDTRVLLLSSGNSDQVKICSLSHWDGSHS